MKQDLKEEAAINEGRIRLELMPPVAEIATVKVLTLGASKYGLWNWRDKNISLTPYLGAMKRHINALMQGEDIDPESGEHHAAHIMATCSIVMDAAEHGTLVDDRPKGVNHADV